MFDRILASLMFFTRLPWWRIKSVDKDCFKHVVEYWPFVGWITGGISVLSFCLFTYLFPYNVAIVFALLVKILLTGALNEDGLADFCDGMGGGTTREKILAIMKDSHIGTYGVVGLIFYFIILYTSLSSICDVLVKNIFMTNPILLYSTIVLSADIWGKSCTSFLIQQLPYARKEDEAKAKVVYSKMTGKETLQHCGRIIIAMLPVFMIVLMFYKVESKYFLLGSIPFIIPILIEMLMAKWLKKTIQGYTGDCCGAIFLISELSFIISVLGVVHLVF